VKIDILKNNTIVIVLATLLVLSLTLGIYLLSNTEDEDTSDTLIFEPSDDCTVSETACEEMDLLSSCPDDSICKEMVVGWSSGDMGCPTYTVRCFEEMD
jgi:hypothetical protein